jgi:hypothetical protein
VKFRQLPVFFFCTVRGAFANSGTVRGEHFRVREQMHCSWRTFPRSRTAALFVANVRFVREQFVHIPTYQCLPWLITPLAVTHTQQQFYYNYAHMHTRRLVECSFGLLKSRFRVTLNGLRVKSMRFAVVVIKAAIVLHNVCLAYNPLTQDEIVALLNDPDIMNDAGDDANEDDEPNGFHHNFDHRNEIIATFPVI